MYDWTRTSDSGLRAVVYQRLADVRDYDLCAQILTYVHHKALLTCRLYGAPKRSQELFAGNKKPRPRAPGLCSFPSGTSLSMRLMLPQERPHDTLRCGRRRFALGHFGP
jgi:hypothetical protein